MNAPDINDSPESAARGSQQRSVVPLGEDWEGNQITEQEPPEKMIRVWQIEPHPSNSEYDSCVCRSYQTACLMARMAIEGVMDSTDPEVIADEGVTVKVQLIQMRKDEYEAIIADNE